MRCRVRDRLLGWSVSWISKGYVSLRGTYRELNLNYETGPLGRVTGPGSLLEWLGLGISNGNPTL
jgi:hypothetical protein